MKLSSNPFPHHANLTREHASRIVTEAPVSRADDVVVRFMDASVDDDIASKSDAVNAVERLRGFFAKIEKLLEAMQAVQTDAPRAAAQKAIRDHLRVTIALATIAFEDCDTISRHEIKTFLGRCKHTLHSLMEDFDGTAAVVCERISPQFDNSKIIPHAVSQFEPSRLEQLTVREREVVDQLMLGHSNKIIAYRMGLSATTVKAHVTKILRKLGVHSRMRAVAIIRSQRGPAADDEKALTPIRRQPDAWS